MLCVCVDCLVLFLAVDSASLGKFAVNEFITNYITIIIISFLHLFQINIDDWFLTTLRAELQIKDGNYRVIRRRVS